MFVFAFEIYPSLRNLREKDEKQNGEDCRINVLFPNDSCDHYGDIYIGYINTAYATRYMDHVRMGKKDPARRVSRYPAFNIVLLR